MRKKKDQGHLVDGCLFAEEEQEEDQEEEEEEEELNAHAQEVVCV
jgi:hypothetical protein